MAQCGASLLPLGFTLASRVTCPMTSSCGSYSFRAASNFRVPEVNFYRAVQSKEPQTIAQAVALTFMGRARRELAESAPRRNGGLLLPNRLQIHRGMEREIVYFDPQKGAPGPAALFPDGAPARIAPGQDPREVFANWLLAPGILVRAQIVNRIWYCCSAAASFTNRTISAPTTPPSIPTY